MTDIDALVNAVKDTALAREVWLVHDEARARYRLDFNTVNNFRSFEDEIAKYYNYHYCKCVSNGGLSRTEALGRAKELLEREYRRRRSDIVGAFNDSRDGTNGGLRSAVDAIAEGLKLECTERFVLDQFDSRIPPDDFEAKVSIIRQFIARFGDQLGDSIQLNRPERYAHDYRDIIRAYVANLDQTSSLLRRI